MHLLRHSVLPDHPDLAREGAVGMDGAFLLYHVFQRGCPHLRKESVHFVQVMLLLGQQVQDEEDDCLQVHLCRLIPEGLLAVGARADGLCHLLHVLFAVVVAVPVELHVPALPDVGQGIVAPRRVRHLCEVQVHDCVALFPQVLPVQPVEVPLGVGHNQAVLGMEEVGHHIAPGLAASGGAHQQVVVVAPRDPGVIADEDVLREDTFGLDVVVHSFPSCF